MFLALIDSIDADVAENLILSLVSIFAFGVLWTFAAIVKSRCRKTRSCYYKGRR